MPRKGPMSAFISKPTGSNNANNRGKENVPPKLGVSNPVDHYNHQIDNTNHEEDVVKALLQFSKVHKFVATFPTVHTELHNMVYQFVDRTGYVPAFGYKIGVEKRSHYDFANLIQVNQAERFCWVFFKGVIRENEFDDFKEVFLEFRLPFKLSEAGLNKSVEMLHAAKNVMTLNKEQKSKTKENSQKFKLLPLATVKAKIDECQQTKWGKSRVPCGFCGKNFTNSNSAVKHIKNDHGRIPFERCPFCPENFTRTYSAYYHIFMHMGVYREKCKFCSSTFLHTDHFKSHNQSLHGFCVYCETTIASPDRFKRKELDSIFAIHRKICNFNTSKEAKKAVAKAKEAVAKEAIAKRAKSAQKMPNGENDDTNVNLKCLTLSVDMINEYGIAIPFCLDQVRSIIIFQKAEICL